MIHCSFFPPSLMAFILISPIYRLFDYDFFWLLEAFLSFTLISLMFPLYIYRLPYSLKISICLNFNLFPPSVSRLAVSFCIRLALIVNISKYSASIDDLMPINFLYRSRLLENLRKQRGLKEFLPLIS